MSRRSDKYAGRQNFSVVNGIHNRQLARPVQDFRKQAGTVLGSMENYEYRSREVPRQCGENRLQDLETTCRTADDNNVSVRHDPPSELGCGIGCGRDVLLRAPQAGGARYLGGGQLNQALSRGDDQGVGFWDSAQYVVLSS